MNAAIEGELTRMERALLKEQERERALDRTYWAPLRAEARSVAARQSTFDMKALRLEWAHSAEFCENTRNANTENSVAQLSGFVGGHRGGVGSRIPQI